MNGANSRSASSPSPPVAPPDAPTAGAPELIDSHSHIDDARFDADRGQVLARARQAGVRTQIVPAITAASWPGLKQVCHEHTGLYPAYGLHPIFIAEHGPGDLERLPQWLQRERPVAVGECGLDFWIDAPQPERQREIFLGQLRLAREFDLPVIVHARKALDEVIANLRRIGGLRGVLHSFSGSLQQAQQLWRLGFHLGIGGPVTYPRAQRLRRIVAQMPIEHLLLETDSPDQPLSGHQGRRNEPARLPQVLAVVAQLRGQSPAALAAATSANARQLFKLPAEPDADTNAEPGPATA